MYLFVQTSICSNDAWHSLEIPITLLSSIQSPLIILTEYSWKKYSRLVFSKTSRHSGQLLKLSQVTFKLYLYLRMCSINQLKPSSNFLRCDANLTWIWREFDVTTLFPLRYSQESSAQRNCCELFIIINIRIAFTFAGSMSWALCWFIEHILK